MRHFSFFIFHLCQPTVSDSSEMEAPPTNFGAEPAAELCDVYNPDDGYYGMMAEGSIVP